MLVDEMPRLSATQQELIDSSVEFTKERLEVSKAFRDRIEENIVRDNQRMQTAFAKLGVVLGAFNSVLKVFGKDIKLFGLDVVGFIEIQAQLSVLKKQHDDQTEYVISAFSTKTGSERTELREKLEDLFQEVFGDVKSRSKRNQWIAAYHRRSQDVAIKTIELQNRLEEQALDLQSAVVLLNDKFGDEYRKCLDFVWKVYDSVDKILNALNVILDALKISSFIANVGPFNTLPGTIAIIQGYLSLFADFISEITNAANSFGQGTHDFHKLALELTVVLDQTFLSSVIPTMYRTKPGKTTITYEH